MSKNWEAERSQAPKPKSPTDGMSDAESWEYLRGLKPEPQHEPRPQEKPTNTHDFGDSRAMAEFYSNNPFSLFFQKRNHFPLFVPLKRKPVHTGSQSFNTNTCFPM